jgi:hypothetical protein
MRRPILAVALAFFPAPAVAQQPERVIPRVEIGLGTGVAVHPHFDSTKVVQTRVGVGITRRFGFEAVVDIAGWRFDRNNLDLFYTLQGRYALNPNPGRLRTSVTFGVTGTIERLRIQEYRYRRPDGVEGVAPARTYVETFPPIVPTVGVAVHYAVTRRIGVRVDAQAVVCPYFDAVGTLVSAGVAIPIPSLRSGS